MKKLAIAFGIAAVLAGSAFANGESLVVGEGGLEASTSPSTATLDLGSGSVSFFGKMIAPTCEFSTGSKNQQVTLPDLMTHELDQGQTKSADFAISLSGCPVTGQRSLVLRFVSSHQENGVLLNTVSEGTNAALKISNKDGDQVVLGQSKEDGLSVKKSLEQGGEVEFNFTAEYVKRDANIKTVAGDFRAQAQFFVEYK